MVKPSGKKGMMVAGFSVASMVAIATLILVILNFMKVGDNEKQLDRINGFITLGMSEGAEGFKGRR